jgi:hypothetical protein
VDVRHFLCVGREGWPKKCARVLGRSITALRCFFKGEKKGMMLGGNKGG